MNVTPADLYSELAQSGGISGLTTAAIPLAASATTLGDSLLIYDSAYGIGGGTGTRPTFVASASGSFITSRTSPTQATGPSRGAASSRCPGDRHHGW